MNDFVELQRLISVVLRRWYLLLVLMALGAGAGYAISLRQTPAYQATTTVLVGQITQASSITREDVQLSELFAQTYADLAVRQPVMQGVVEALQLDISWQQLQERVRVTPISGTQLIEIRAEASTPRLAERIADEIAVHLLELGPERQGEDEQDFAQSFIQRQMNEAQLAILEGQQRLDEVEREMEATTSSTRLLALQEEKAELERLIADQINNYVQLSGMTAQSRSPNSLTVIETAHADPDPIRPRRSINLMLGAGLGLLLGLGGSFLWEFLEDTVKGADDLAVHDGLALLGTVGRIHGRTEPGRLVASLEPSSPVAESFRMIRNRLLMGSGEQPVSSVVITSPAPGEGKSLTAANLAVIMAHANVNTVLVDADLRQPSLHHLFQLEEEGGLAELLNGSGQNPLKLLKKTSVAGLRVLTCGDVPEGLVEQINLERVSEVLECLEQDADAVIIDAPPALLTAEAMMLANQAGGVVLVARSGKTRRRALRQTLAELRATSAHLIGCVLVDEKMRPRKGYHYYRKREKASK